VGVSELDVRSGESWQGAWQSCQEGLGVPSVLVNIAGIKGEDHWETLYDVNVVGAQRYISSECFFAQFI